MNTTSQFEKDTESGYRNAAEYYAQALEELSQMEPDPEQTDKYALNYAASLYRSGRGDEARSAAEPYLSGQNQEILLAMQAEEAYRQRDDAAVLDYTERIWDRQPDPDILAVVTRLAAHAAKRSERWDDAALWGSRSLEADSRDENRRKVAALMVLAGAERGRSSDFQTAEQVLSGLKEWTQEDCLNLAEILYREGYYTRCVSQLVKLSTSDEALLCRQAYLRAACAVEQEEPENAVEWGEKAARYYKKLTQRQRENVDLDALQDLCRSLGVEEELGR